MGVIVGVTTVAETVFAAMLTALLWLAVGGLLERAAPARRVCDRGRLFNLACLAPCAAVRGALGPPQAAAVVTLVNHVGFGGVALSAAGWAVVPSVAVYLVVMDLGEYLFHRAQHRVPILWAMHALHHSDRAFNVSTTVRHFWLESILKSVTIYPIVAIILRPDPAVVVIYGVLSGYNYFTHMNCRVGFGRWAWLLNSPQLHRLHHSASPEHHDRNFAALLPLFDVLSGAFAPAQPGEYPATGLGDGQADPSWFDILAWPLRPSRSTPAA